MRRKSAISVWGGGKPGYVRVPFAREGEGGVADLDDILAPRPRDAFVKSKKRHVVGTVFVGVGQQFAVAPLVVVGLGGGVCDGVRQFA